MQQHGIQHPAGLLRRARPTRLRRHEDELLIHREGVPFDGGLRPAVFSALSTIAASQESAQTSASQEPLATTAEEIVVRGQRAGELRRELWRAEQAVFDFFHAINSDDRFDISCRWEPLFGSRIRARVCRSNGWRAQQANYGPFDAKLMFEVEIGRDPWSHRLTEHTFAIAHVSGHIRRVVIQCDEGRERHKYEGEIMWTPPPGCNACVLQVSAKRGTTFAVYELD